MQAIMEDSPTKWTWKPRLTVGLLTTLGLGLGGFVLWAGKDWRLAREAVALLEQAGKSDTEVFTVGYAKWGSYWAALVNAVLCLLLAATHRWWAAGGRALGTAVILPKVERMGWIVLAVALILGGALRWHRAGLSFYNDEAHTFKRYLAGTFRADARGEVKWRQISWLKTFFFNQVGNNATPTSALSRVSYAAWGQFSKASVGEINERAVRLPGILASLGGIVFLWLTARRLFSTRTAGWVALLAASHFWMVRYGNEARGYALTLLALGGMAYFFCRGRETQRWGWWMGVGFMQFLTLWSFSGAVYFLAVLDVGWLMLAVWGICRKGHAVGTFYRPLVGMIFGAMLTLQLMLPTLPQLVEAIQAIPSMKGPMNVSWWQDVVSGLSSGLRWETGTGSLWNKVIIEHPLLAVVYASGWVLVAVGIWRLKGSGSGTRLLCLAGLLAIVLSWAAMSARGLYLHHWYVLCALPGLLLLCGQALNGAAKAAPIWDRLLTICAGSLVGFHLAVNGLLWNEGKENIRGVREALPGTPLQLGALFSDVDAYAKYVTPFSQKSAEAATADLEELMLKASREQVPLYIDFTRRPILAAQMPVLLARLENPVEFTQIKTLASFDEPQFTHYLVRWNGP